MSEKESSVLAVISKQVKGCVLKKSPQDLTQLPQLSDNELCSYPGLLVGNDPWVGDANLSHYQISENFVFIGTSLFGALEYACSLPKPTQSRKIVPQLIIIDNSKEVITCWQKLQTFFSTTSLDSKSNSREILTQLMDFLLDELWDLIRDKKVADYKYFRAFFLKHDFDLVKIVICEAIILKQSWDDINTFRAIKTAFPQTSIVAYPSNIISYVDTEECQLNILRCIEILNPILCIYSDIAGLEGQRKPTKTMVASRPFTVNEIASSLGLKLVIEPEPSERADEIEMHSRGREKGFF